MSGYEICPSHGAVTEAILAALDEMGESYEEAMEREGVNKYRREHIHDIAGQLARKA